MPPPAEGSGNEVTFMNSYERVRTVLEGGIPDRVPSFELLIDPHVTAAIVPNGD